MPEYMPVHPTARMEDCSWAKIGHWYQWIGPNNRSIPNSSFEMLEIHNNRRVKCTAKIIRNIVVEDGINTGTIRFSGISGAWYWGHLQHYFVDLSTKPEPIPPGRQPKKGEKLTISVRGIAKPLDVLVMDNRVKANARLVLVNGGLTMVVADLIEQRR